MKLEIRHRSSFITLGRLLAAGLSGGEPNAARLTSAAPASPDTSSK